MMADNTSLAQPRERWRERDNPHVSKPTFQPHLPSKSYYTFLASPWCHVGQKSCHSIPSKTIIHMFVIKRICSWPWWRTKRRVWHLYYILNWNVLNSLLDNRSLQWLRRLCFVEFNSTSFFSRDFCFCDGFIGLTFQIKSSLLFIGIQTPHDKEYSSLGRIISEIGWEIM